MTINDLNITNKHVCIFSSNVGMTETVKKFIRNNRFVTYIHISKNFEIDKYTLPGEFHQVGF